jgi:8-oxo-dGTP diphosphatase
VISVAYFALVAAERLRRVLGEASAEPLSLARVSVEWEGEEGGSARAVGEDGDRLALAFDHGAIIGMAVKRLRGRLRYSPIGYEMLPRRFTLRQLQDIHEAILGRDLNKDSFRRRVLASGEVAPTGERESEVGHRPAELYTFTGRTK